MNTAIYRPTPGTLYICKAGGFIASAGTVDNNTMRMRFYDVHPLKTPRDEAPRYAILSNEQVFALING
jgi:hypothetical protein